MNRNGLFLSAALKVCLGLGAMACNGLVRNDSGSPAEGDRGGQSRGALGQAGSDAAVGGDVIVGAPIADESPAVAPDPEAGSEAASDSGAESGASTYACTGSGCSGSAPVCLNGACVACSPRTTQCLGNGVETCEANGRWGTVVACASSQSCSDGACAIIKSCQSSEAGTTNCGSASESCCTSLEVTGGSYYRTYVNSGGSPTGEADPASISDFRLDKYEVTVGRFRQFVDAWNNGSGYLPPAGSGKHAHLNAGLGLANGGSPATYETGWDAADWNSQIEPTNANMKCSLHSAGSDATWTDSAGSQENLPINCVNWYEAYAFCIWDGGFLPSEAEWEYAAAGGSQQREYPWGSTPPGTGNQYAIYDCNYPNSSASGAEGCIGVMNLAPVGTSTAGGGVWGQLDLAGELYEHTLDWYNASYVDPCADCAYLTTTDTRVYRGGNFNNGLSLPADRHSYPPTERYMGQAGLRCARTP